MGPGPSRARAGLGPRLEPGLAGPGLGANIFCVCCCFSSLFLLFVLHLLMKLAHLLCTLCTLFLPPWAPVGVAETPHHHQLGGCATRRRHDFPPQALLGGSSKLQLRAKGNDRWEPARPANLMLGPCSQKT